MRKLLIIATFCILSAVLAEEKPDNKAQERVEFGKEKDGSPAEYTYDIHGQLIKKRVNPGRGDEAVWMYEYNESGQLISMRTPIGLRKLFEYETPKSKKPRRIKIIREDGTEEDLVEPTKVEHEAPEF